MKELGGMVAPLAGAWVEMPSKKFEYMGEMCRSPCGSVG